MAEHGSDYHRGEMEIQEQTATYALFMNMTKWGSLALTVLLLPVIIWFCTDAGFVAGAVSALVVLVVGILLLRDKGGH